MKNKEILVPMKYTGPVACEIVGLGKFQPGETRKIPERFARELRHDRNWKRLRNPESSKHEKSVDPKTADPRKK